MADLRRELGVVLQDTFLFSGNVADNLRLDAPVSDQQLVQVCAELGLNDLLSRLPKGLETELRERGGNLSSGERQLLAVARVAIRNPTVLVMDEATAFMDPSTEATLRPIWIVCCRSGPPSSLLTGLPRWKPPIASLCCAVGN